MYVPSPKVARHLHLIWLRLVLIVTCVKVPTNGKSGFGRSIFGSRTWKMPSSTGLVSRDPAHFGGVHASEVFVFAVAAKAAFADAVVQLATLVLKLVNGEALTDVSAVDNQTFGHA